MEITSLSINCLFTPQDLGEKQALIYVDSTPLAVCHNKRIYRHKTFEGIAEAVKHR